MIIIYLIVVLWRNGFMKKYNVIVVFDKNMDKTLMCKRTKEPYMGMYNLVGGKIEKDNDGLNEAYRELYEETNISDKDISLEHFMNIEYIAFDKMIEVYYGVLNKDVVLIEEVNKLEWVNVDDNFFDMNRYAGEGNIGHIIEEIKISLSK
jgi:hydrolase, NUDIX family